MTLPIAKQILKTRSTELTRKQNENALMMRQINDCETKIEQATSKLAIGLEALRFLEDVANSRRGQIKKRIEDIVTEALRMVYGDEYKIEISYSVKNNRSCLDIDLVKSTAIGEIKRDIEGFGGGVADTISVPLRLMILFSTKQTDRVVVLDECFKHMDLHRIDRVAEFFRVLAEKLKMQIIMVSHHEALKSTADRMYQVTESNGKSTVTAN